MASGSLNSSTRRKYRSPVHYCDTKAKRTVRRGAPFTRDIPIFGQSGGYTFRVAGPHRIFCTFRLRDGSMVTSNVVDAFVKPASLTTVNEHRRAALSGLNARP